jgi:hypothetical protein
MGANPRPAALRDISVLVCWNRFIMALTGACGAWRRRLLLLEGVRVCWLGLVRLDVASATLFIFMA